MKERSTMQDDVKPQTVFRDGLFKDKVVLVSGGGTGLGKAAAEQFARLGASLIICGRDAERLEAAAADLRKFGGRVMAAR
jgi:citronellol/citronellal dehydrogenase